MAELTETEIERAQMQKLQTLRQIVTVILLRHIWKILTVAAVVFAGVFTLMAFRVRSAPDRFEARTGLTYNPRAAGKVQTMDKQEVLRILSRREVRRKLSEVLQLSEDEAARVGTDIQVELQRQPKNLYIVTVRAPSSVAAVRKVNAFAELCIKEYVGYRMADLESWLETIMVRKREIEDQIAKSEQTETNLGRKMGVSSPNAEADRLTRAATDRRTALVEVRLALSAAELKKKKAENDLKTISTNFVEHADTVRQFIERRRKDRTELSNLRHQYSEKNPRYLICKEKLDENEAEFRAFLNKYGIKDVEDVSVRNYAALQAELKDAEAKIELGHQTEATLVREIERLDTQFSELLALLPEFDRLASQRRTMRQTLDDLDSMISDIRYLESTCGADLTQTEAAQGALGDSPFGKKSFLAAAGAVVLVAGGLLLLIVLYELRFGYVTGAREVGFHPELRPLGALPANDSFPDEAEARKVCDGIFYRYRRECSEGVVFLGVLPGSNWSRRFDASFSWNLAMSGLQGITVQLVRALEFVEPKDAEFFGGIVKSGEEAWMPVTDTTALSPGEIQLLETGIRELRQAGYGLVFVRRREPLTRGEIYTLQLATMCDRAILFVASRRTRRGQLQDAISVFHSAKPAEIMAVTTSVMTEDELKEGNFR